VEEGEERQSMNAHKFMEKQSK